MITISCGMDECHHTVRSISPALAQMRFDEHLQEEHDTTFEEQWEEHGDEIREELAEHGIIIE